MGARQLSVRWMCRRRGTARSPLSAGGAPRACWGSLGCGETARHRLAPCQSLPPPPPLRQSVYPAVSLRTEDCGRCSGAQGVASGEATAQVLCAREPRHGELPLRLSASGGPGPSLLPLPGLQCWATVHVALSPSPGTVALRVRLAVAGQASPLSGVLQPRGIEWLPRGSGQWKGPLGEATHRGAEGPWAAGGGGEAPVLTWGSGLAVAPARPERLLLEALAAGRLTWPGGFRLPGRGSAG